MKKLNLRTLIWSALITLSLGCYAFLQAQPTDHLPETENASVVDDADEGEDKIVKRAKELNEHPMELVDRQIYRYNQFIDKLNLKRPNLAPRATAHITEMIDLVETLISKKHGYEVDGSIYYDISSYSDYGKLAKLDFTKNLNPSAGNTSR